MAKFWVYDRMAEYSLNTKDYMIGYLKGRVIDKTLYELWIDVRDVGYRVKVGVSMLEGLGVGDEVELYIHTAVRDDAIDLYGFESMASRSMFELILGVSGVGPKIGLAVVGSNSVEKVERAVREADVAFFQAVPGIGKKGAQRIIVDLKGKLPSVKELDLGDDGNQDDEVMSALMQFGFSRAEVRAVMKDMDRDLDDEERMREGLRRLGRGR